MTNFIELDRSFVERSSVTDKGAELPDSRGKGRELTWDQLLVHPRLIIIAEGGAGKTSELKNKTRLLRSEGKIAFFLRLEEVADNFEGAFHTDQESLGTYEQFNDWLDNNGQKAWLFLDAVDEARIKDESYPKKAIKHLYKKLDERGREKVNLCVASRPVYGLTKELNNELERLFPLPGEVVQPEPLSDVLDLSGSTYTNTTTLASTNEKDEKAFKIYSLSAFSEEQVKRYVTEKGMIEADDFMQALECQHAWSFAERPMDLDRTMQYWSDYGNIGTSSKILEHYIEHNLREVPSRQIRSSLSLEKARQGAELLAVAVTLQKKKHNRPPRHRLRLPLPRRTDIAW